MADEEVQVQVKNLRQSLEEWKEILLPIKSVLLWDNQWHPTAIVGVSTIFFTIIWLLDPSILSTLSLIGLTLTISDYLVPVVAKSMFKAETWTPTKEKQFDELCQSIIVYYNKIDASFATYVEKRTTNPKLYYLSTIAALALLAWIGNTLNNLFLTYVFVTVVLLVPGMEYHGILKKYGLMVSQKLTSFTTDAKAKLSQTKKEQ